jgi:hypothetical protein
MDAGWQPKGCRKRLPTSMWISSSRPGLQSIWIVLMDDGSFEIGYVVLLGVQQVLNIIESEPALIVYAKEDTGNETC